MPRFLRQFGLRTLLLFCFVAAVCFGLLRWHMDGIHRQHVVAKELLERNARIQWQTSGPKWLRDVVGDYYFTELVMVDLQMRGQEDDELSLLRDLPALERLYLAGNPLISDQGLDHLRTLKHVRRLSLWGTGVTDEGLSKLSHLEALEALDLKDTKVTQAGLAKLVGLKNLRELHHRFLLDDDGLTAIAQLPRLQIRDLKVNGLTERGFALLKNISFTQLTIENTQYADWPRHLISHPTMTEIVGHQSRTNSASFKQMLASKQFTLIRLKDVSVSDEILPELAVQKSLGNLLLNGTEITADEFLRQFAARDPQQIYINDVSVRMLENGMPWINVMYSGKVVMERISGLDGIQNTTTLSLVAKQDVVDLSHLPDKTLLKRVWIQGTLKDADWHKLAMQEELHTIIVIGKDQPFTSAGLLTMKDRETLRSLRLDIGKLSNEHLAAIGEFQSLEALILGPDSNVTSEGFQHLIGLRNLKALEIDFSEQVDDQILAELAKLEGLETVTIGRSLLTDEGISYLRKMPNLTELGIRHISRSPSDLLRLQKALPSVKVRLR